MDNTKSFCLCRLFLSTLITILEIKVKFKYVAINTILFVKWYLKIEKAHYWTLHFKKYLAE